MVSFERALEIFRAENFYVYTVNNGKAALIYLPDKFGFDGRVTSIHSDCVFEENNNKIMFVKFKVNSKNYHPKIGFDWDEPIDLKEISADEFSTKVRNLMDSAILCYKQVHAAKKLNNVKKDF